MSLSPLVSFKPRFVTYLLNFPRTCPPRHRRDLRSIGLTQPRVVVPSRNVGTELAFYAAWNTKKSTDITHIAAQAWNLTGIT